MKRPRLRTIGIMVLAGLSGALLLHTSQNVQQAEDRLAALRASVQGEEENIRVLNAEWAYLNSPERLESLASDLGLMPPQPAQIVEEPAILPEMPGAEGLEDAPSDIAQPVSWTAPEKPPVIPARKPAPPGGDFQNLIRKLNEEGQTP